MATDCKRCAIPLGHPDLRFASSNLMGLLPKVAASISEEAGLDFVPSAIGSSQSIRPAPHSSVAVRIPKRCYKVRTHGTVE